MASKTMWPPRPSPRGPAENRAGGLMLATGYLGVICFGPLPPLVLLLVTRHAPFYRRHATQALNTALTWLIYLVCAAIGGGVLALDSVTVALAVMIPVVVAGWVCLAVLLVRAAAAAARGEFRALPGWACGTLVRGA